MGLKPEYEYAQTPLDGEELGALKIKSITTLAELNEAEQLNIEKALRWILKKRFKKERILSEEFIKELHRKMYGDVWKWAGKFRKSGKNIGSDWTKIGADLKSLLDDTIYWIENDTYVANEIAIRFKHRLVLIHCFPNGNGRHSRLMADIIIESIFGKEIFSWCQSNMVEPSEIRTKYINALWQADKGDYWGLIEFARGAV